MKFNFAKTLLMSSVLAMGAFGLVACGDKGTGTKPPPKDASIIVRGQDAIVAGTIAKFEGEITTDNEGVDQDADFAIDSLKLAVKDANMNKTKVVPSPDSYKAVSKVDNVSLGFIGTTVMLDDPGFTTCGTFYLDVTIYAHLDKNKKISSIQIPFERNADLFCQAPASSSGSETPTGIEMVPYEVTMSTDQRNGLDLASGTVSASTTTDIVISKGANKSVIVSSGNGTLFSAITNEQSTPSNYDDDYMVDYWPEVENGHAYVSDFKFKFITKSQIAVVETGSPSQEIFVAQTATGDPATGVGFFAFAVTDAKPGMNGDFTITMKVYKKK